MPSCSFPVAVAERLYSVGHNFFKNFDPPRVRISFRAYDRHYRNAYDRLYGSHVLRRTFYRASSNKNMNIERDTAVEIVVSVAAVVLFTIAMVVIGNQYYTNGFSPTGAITLVVAIGGFVVLMLLVSYVLSSR
jgi:hypothetical protein